MTEPVGRVLRVGGDIVSFVEVEVEWRDSVGKSPMVKTVLLLESKISAVT